MPNKCNNVSHCTNALGLNAGVSMHTVFLVYEATAFNFDFIDANAN